mmetsp:Transcript_127714/g.367592  ORF Transcript_127714/g.367592 Transcript_127714/m.367592 type:complete len:203 (-) Transcript_127714:1263-1871(-)
MSSEPLGLLRLSLVVLPLPLALPACAAYFSSACFWRASRKRCSTMSISSEGTCPPSWMDARVSSSECCIVWWLANSTSGCESAACPPSSVSCPCPMAAALACLSSASFCLTSVSTSFRPSSVCMSLFQCSSALSLLALVRASCDPSPSSKDPGAGSANISGSSSYKSLYILSGEGYASSMTSTASRSMSFMSNSPINSSNSR